MKSGRPSLPGRRRLPSSAETFLLPVKLAVSGLDSYHDLTCLPLVDSYRTLAMMKVKRISELFPQYSRLPLMDDYYSENVFTAWL
ncbi:hypothetical protein MLD38_035821 [Melastoma candidum]|uniref:Uncharacterized protein n=2 Tax=Melastoma candidum TaxID=119954 RepID=A0ACB9LIB3_9MYRT|nr:hypothetical protein MLD38_035819 [Melastoma candidum]KAI4310874.1 hypothetical protein MLD38_035821 [Melastoma candidum]